MDPRTSGASAGKAARSPSTSRRSTPTCARCWPRLQCPRRRAGVRTAVRQERRHGLAPRARATTVIGHRAVGTCGGLVLRRTANCSRSASAAVRCSAGGRRAMSCTSATSLIWAPRQLAKRAGASTIVPRSSRCPRRSASATRGTSRASLPAGCKMLLLTMDYPQEQMAGPPFAVAESEVRSLYDRDFSVRMLTTPRRAARGTALPAARPARAGASRPTCGRSNGRPGAMARP